MKQTTTKEDTGLINLAEEIKSLVANSKIKLSRGINNHILITYWQIGKIIVTKEKKGKIDQTTARKLVLDLSKILTRQIGKGYSRSNIFNMRNFYLKYSDVQTLSGHLGWSHYCELLLIEDEQIRSFYEKECYNSSWSVRELKRQIESSLFERLLLSAGNTNKKKVLSLSKKGHVLEKPSDIIKDPYVFEFLNFPEKKPVLEKDLEKRLIKHIEDFLLELGRGFMFVGSQQRITINNCHNYVDMVFYNKILKAYVLIDLKTTKLKPDHVGQMNSYLNYYRTEINDKGDNEPIGIVLCTAKDEIVAEYALGGITRQIFAAKYVNYIPNRDALIDEVQKVIQNK